MTLALSVSANAAAAMPGTVLEDDDIIIPHVPFDSDSDSGDEDEELVAERIRARKAEVCVHKHPRSQAVLTCCRDSHHQHYLPHVYVHHVSHDHSDLRGIRTPHSQQVEALQAQYEKDFARLTSAGPGHPTYGRRALHL